MYQDTTRPPDPRPPPNHAPDLQDSIGLQSPGDTQVGRLGRLPPEIEQTLIFEIISQEVPELGTMHMRSCVRVSVCACAFALRKRTP